VEDRVHGLTSGADDYLIKPFALAQLAARLDALVRRRYGQSQASIQVGPLTIDTVARTVTRDGQPVDLTARELALLEYLARRRGHVVSRGQIEAQLYAGDGHGAHRLRPLRPWGSRWCAASASCSAGASAPRWRRRPGPGPRRRPRPSWRFASTSAMQPRPGDSPADIGGCAAALSTRGPASPWSSTPHVPTGRD
jgi:hypothetical protein